MRLADFGMLTGAERAVVDGLGSGQVTVLGDGELPGDGAGEGRRVRAGLIRWLALGTPGEDDLHLHEHGLLIKGALVVSDGQFDTALGEESTPGLDLEGCTLPHDLVLLFCRFQHAPLLRGARVQSLFLNGSEIPGIKADRLEARGGVHLDSIHATGAVRLLGARIGGELSCIGGQFDNAGGKALNADGLEARGSVFLRRIHATGAVRLLGARIGVDLDCIGGQFDNAGGDALSADGLEARGGVRLDSIHATGAVRLLSARIGGNLVCIGGQFENPFDAEKEKARPGSTGKALDAGGLEAWGGVRLDRVHATGEVQLVSARIGGDLSCDGGQFANAGGKALNAQGARVTRMLFWREGSRAEGVIDLTGAEVGHINDDPACWPGPGDLLLNRCRYGAFIGKGVSGAERIRWLDLQAPEKYGDEFWPQPWEQCAKVLREMGHARDARQVLIAREARQRAARRERLRRERQGTWRHALDPVPVLRDALLGALIAYGHKPLRALGWLAALWITGAVLFAVAWGAGGFKPGNAVILHSPEWVQCATDGDRRGDHPSTLACYLAQPEAAGYPAFDALVYSVDTLVPVVDLQVQDYWLPDARVASWARWYLWAQIAAGWALTLLAVAGFSGLVQNRAGRE